MNAPEELSRSRSLAVTAAVFMDSLGSTMATATVTLVLATSDHAWLIGVQLALALAPRALLGRRVGRWIARSKTPSRILLGAQIATVLSGAIMLIGGTSTSLVGLLLVGVLLVNTFKIVDGLLTFESLGALAKQDRERHVGRFSAARNAALIGGAPFAATIWAAYGPAAALVVNLCSYVIPILVYPIFRALLAHSQTPRNTPTARNASVNLRLPTTAIVAILGYVAFGFFSSLQSPATIKFVTETMELSPVWFGLLEAIWGVGALSASLMSSHLQMQDKNRTFALCVLAYAVSLTAAALWPVLAVVIPAYVVAACGLVLGNIAFMNLLFDTLEPHHRLAARASAMAWQAVALAVGFTFGGLFLTFPRELTLTSGLTCLALGLILWVLWTRPKRHGDPAVDR